MERGREGVSEGGKYYGGLIFLSVHVCETLNGNMLNYIIHLKFAGCQIN